ncbi:RpiR family transcriptional regulator [Mitsuaria sp. CC2]|uniref:RpiR family transcriptional regulator n=1 Tax=Mitsuaria sp. CC2 TaxID=3029186 RepID=UPI003B8E2576
MSTLLRKNRGQAATADLSALFEAGGWQVQIEAPGQDRGPDLRIKRRARHLTVDIKAPAEGRTDRAIPLLAQAILQAQTYAKADAGAQPLAVLYLEDASDALIGQVGRFVDTYAPGTAVGLVTKSGVRYFRDPNLELEALNAGRSASSRRRTTSARTPVNLFSDLNQWMLKVLLAPDLPPELMKAPRDQFRTGADFAQAAGVSTMSASRLLQQLRQEGHLDDSSTTLRLVRREELLRRWQAASMKSPIQRPMRFVLKTSVEKQLHQLLVAHPAQVCLGLFSAADALRVGHVSGVPPHVIVPSLSRLDDKTWRGLVPVASGAPDLIVRETAAPQSTFRGAVMRDGVACADVLQTWLDVASHPARGEEQAAVIYNQILRPHLLDGTR